jgi:hypothetical protein
MSRMMSCLGFPCLRWVNSDTGCSIRCTLPKDFFDRRERSVSEVLQLIVRVDEALWIPKVFVTEQEEIRRKILSLIN